jgi:signal transduction histidine kinase
MDVFFLLNPLKSLQWLQRHHLIWRVIFIMALPATVSFLTMLVLRLVYGAIPPVATGRFAGSAGWFVPAVPVLAILIITYALIRMGKANVSAFILLIFWTVSITGIVVRFGAHTNFPAMLILPIGAASLLFDRRITMLLTALSSLIVGIAAWFELQRPDIAFYDVLNRQLITDIAQIRTMTYTAVGFWVGIYTAVAFIMALLASSLHTSLRQSAAHAAALEELKSELEARVDHQTNSLLAGERDKAMLAERTRLAREIHDTLAQGLTGIIVQLGAAQQAHRAQHPDLAEHLDYASRMARESLTEARRSVWNLRAEALTHGDLRDALHSLVTRLRHPHLHASFRCVGNWRPIPADIESALLRVAQEALANAVRHSGADHVTMTLCLRDTVLTLTIRDNGCGFDPALHTSTTASPTFGILGMRERITALHGRLTLSTDAGAVVHVEIDLGEHMLPHTEVV